MLAQSLIALVGILSAQAAKASPGQVLLNELPTAKYVSSAMANAPTKKNPDTFGVEITAKAGAVLDVASGRFLFEKDANAPYAIASLTKLVTVMTFLDTHPNLDEQMTILPQDDTGEGSSVFLANERLTKREVMRSALIGSVNAAAAALARSTGDTDAFIKAMNAKARSLGMTHATFADPTGLDPKNQASAKDVALALRAALLYHDIRESTEQDSLDVKGRTTGHVYHIKTTNLLLDSFLNKGLYRIVAGKTGSLPEAGYCLAQATQNEDEHEIIAVVLGSESHFARFQDAKALTWWAFQNYEWPSLAQK